MGFCYFLKLKSDIAIGLEKVVQGIWKFGYLVKFFRCNGAGENDKHVQALADREGIQMEYTPSNTPQYNGVVERRITVLKDMARTMMAKADLEPVTRNYLWTEAVRCLN